MPDVSLGQANALLHKETPPPLYHVGIFLLPTGWELGLAGGRWRRGSGIEVHRPELCSASR